MKDQTILRRICIICFVAMVVMLVVHVQVLVMFNRQELAVSGNDSSAKAYMEIGARESATSSWLKRDYALSEDLTADLTGQTIDGTLYNNSGDTIQEWGLRINIAGDCYINQMWTGDAEIHQFAGTEQETVQRLNLQDYRLEDLTLRYQFDGDLLIPLQQGDYLLYYPNEHNSEMPLESGDSRTIGMIFYYLDSLDLSDYTLTLRFHRGFAQGWSFIAFIVIASLWLLSSVVYGTGFWIYRNAKKQLEMRKSGLLSMSELYKIIYIVNLPAGEITPVSAGEYIEELRAGIRGAKELLDTAVREDAEDAYLDAAVDFVNVDTLAERLKDRDSIAYDFAGKHYGWCSIRFFAMDRAENGMPENVIFTVQDINDERNEMKLITDRLAKAEATSLANTAFLSGVSRDLQAPVRDLIALDEKIMEETDPEAIRSHAKSLHSLAERMLLLIRGMADRAGMETGKVKPAEENYSLRQVITEALGTVLPEAENTQTALELEVSESLPSVLRGDALRLKEALVSLAAFALHRGGAGTVRLSVFGKVLEDTVHLLFSVRTAPESGEPSADLPARREGPAAPELDLEIAGSLLTCLGSELKTVQSADAWRDTYFEIDQRIADAAPVGKITVEDAKR